MVWQSLNVWIKIRIGSDENFVSVPEADESGASEYEKDTKPIQAGPEDNWIIGRASDEWYLQFEFARKTLGVCMLAKKHLQVAQSTS